jgi:hypothetical protein
MTESYSSPHLREEQKFLRFEIQEYLEVELGRKGKQS